MTRSLPNFPGIPVHFLTRDPPNGRVGSQTSNYLWILPTNSFIDSRSCHSLRTSPQFHPLLYRRVYLTFLQESPQTSSMVTSRCWFGSCSRSVCFSFQLSDGAGMNKETPRIIIKIIIVMTGVMTITIMIITKMPASFVRSEFVRSSFFRSPRNWGWFSPG